MSLRLQLLAFGALILALPWAGLRIVHEMEDVLRTELERSMLARARDVARELDNSRLGASLRRESDAATEAATEEATGAPVDQEAPVAATAPIYAHTLAAAPRVDAYRGDWQFARGVADQAAAERAIAERANALDGGHRVWTGVYDNRLYLFLEIADDDIVYRSPGAGINGDRVVLLYGPDQASPNALLIATAAPSASLVAQRTRIGRFVPAGGEETTVQAAWRERRQGRGFTVEIRMPLWNLGDRLGYGVIDVDRTSIDSAEAGPDPVVTMQSTWDDADPPTTRAVIHERTDLVRLLASFAGGGRFRIVRRDGWVLADSGSTGAAATAFEPAQMPLSEQFFRSVLRRSDPSYETLERPPGRIDDPTLLTALAGTEATAWYSQGPEFNAVVAAAVGVRGGTAALRADGADSRSADGGPALEETDDWVGAVVYERASDSVLTATNDAMMRLISTTLLVGLVAAVALLGYASWLSFRVSRLARAADTALGPQGEINAKLPGARAGDEIGDLSRSFEDLLGRLSDYTDYLKTLKSKLSHELRTPLAIVSTSLDNLEHEPASEPAQAYRSRLRHGVERLESILQAMTAATRVEHAVAQTAREHFDLAQVVAACLKAYGDVYPDHAFAPSLPSEPLVLDGSADLIEQLLDKLVDNAVGFAAAGTAIEIELEGVDGEARLAVRNYGPLLPESMRHQLFDSLVSVRDGGSGKPHLGLGLYIVNLIAEFHRGAVSADNLPDGDGVEISVALPTDAGAH